MKKSITMTLFSILLLGVATFSFARKQKTEQGTEWRCSVGNSAICVYAPWDFGYDCSPPPQPMSEGDCGGMVQVVTID